MWRVIFEEIKQCNEPSLISDMVMPFMAIIIYKYIYIRYPFGLQQFKNAWLHALPKDMNEKDMVSLYLVDTLDP